MNFLACVNLNTLSPKTTLFFSVSKGRQWEENTKLKNFRTGSLTETQKLNTPLSLYEIVGTLNKYEFHFVYFRLENLGNFILIDIIQK